MPICIHCTTPIQSLYMRYGRDHIVLSPCTSVTCSPSTSSTTALTDSGVVLADEYLEHDLPIVIIDLILAKPAAYRHLLFNRSSIFAPSSPSVSSQQKDRGSGRGNRWYGEELWTLLKRFLALSLVDAYIRWFYLCVRPPINLPTETVSSAAAGKLSTKVTMWLQEQLPMQAGVFSPSSFTPRATNAVSSPGWLGEGERAIGAVCSATPLWLARSAKGGGGGGERGSEMLPTLVSYVNVLLVTLVEGGALQICVGLLTWVAVRRLLAAQRGMQRSSAPSAPAKLGRSTKNASDVTTVASSDTLRNRLLSAPPAPQTQTQIHTQPHHTPTTTAQTRFNIPFDPLLGCKALLLSQLSPLILLTFVLLWSSKFPHSHSLNPSINHPSSTSGGGLDRGWTVWIIRTFLASLNAGVAIGTVLPRSNDARDGKEARGKEVWWPPLILGAGWTVQAAVSWGMYSWLS
ncbi:related to ARV1 - protein functioning in transport of glycosylphosphatidylinositol intermediates into ER lumen [Ustilago trichophora]|uniref:Protein ARV n=1 Tax=Ustilago trichophora TaxID=86804 RepID=A0A5C3DTK6_9BASI|nr:related to ARV1 - protein functioning in transport of glycosylphosphatidylinositol intermediates into ER lumen [Ustilago trichophora]